jgi:hypothetical protein
MRLSSSTSVTPSAWSSDADDDYVAGPHRTVGILVRDNETGAETVERFDPLEGVEDAAVLSRHGGMMLGTTRSSGVRTPAYGTSDTHCSNSAISWRPRIDDT